MAMIRPSSDLRNHYNEISEFCHKYHEPVYITKNGSGDLVVMTNEEYDRITGKAELHRLLDEGIEDVRRHPPVPAKEAILRLAEEFGLNDL